MACRFALAIMAILVFSLFLPGALAGDEIKCPSPDSKVNLKKLLTPFYFHKIRTCPITTEGFFYGGAPASELHGDVRQIVLDDRTHLAYMVTTSNRTSMALVIVPKEMKDEMSQYSAGQAIILKGSVDSQSPSRYKTDENLRDMVAFTAVSIAAGDSKKGKGSNKLAWSLGIGGIIIGFLMLVVKSLMASYNKR